MRFSTIIVRNLLRRSVRSALTVIGLAIGIAAVVALIGIAWGFERSFLALYQAKGIDLVVVRAGVSDRLSSTLDEALGEPLRAVDGVNDVAPSLVEAVSFEEANIVSVLVNGWEPASLLFRGVRVLDGRSLRPAERGGAMLGRVLALNLNKRVGDPIEIAGEPFQVVGVYESDSWFENGMMIIPLDELQTMMGRQGQVTAFVVDADEPVVAVKQRIESAIPGVAVAPARDYVRGDLMIRLANSMAWATSVLALVLGSVGMLNTMMMAVFERTREIGTLRALGWRKRRVLALILGESLVMGLLGAGLGAALGVVAVRLLSQVPTASGFIAPEVPMAVLILGAGLGILLSVLGGIYPALRGAGLSPTEALRHE